MSGPVSGPVSGTGAIREIEQLKYRYVRCFDTKDWAGFEATMLPGTTAAYAGLDFADREAILAYMRGHVGPEIVTMHLVHHPEITLTDDGAATGRWYLKDTVFVTSADLVIEGAAFYTDRYVRTPSGWRIAHTGYERTWEASYSVSDRPGWTLKAPGLG